MRLYTWLLMRRHCLHGRKQPSVVGYPGGDAAAKTNYDLAIEQSVRQWNNNSTTGLAAMMATADITYDPAKAMEQIATQRWVHLFMHGYEAWAEWRRTGFPALTTSTGQTGAYQAGIPDRRAVQQ